MGSPPGVRSSLNVMIFVTNAAGCALLAVLVVSISLSQRLHRRDPVVNNFLYTWILLSALGSFDELAILAQRDLGDTTIVREAVVKVITTISTLNLSIHLFYIMRSAFHQSSVKSQKLRTLALVVTPYIFGLTPLYMFHSEDTGTLLVVLFSLIISIVTPITDAFLLFYYWRWYRKTKKAMHGVTSFSFIVRLLAFSLYQLCYAILFFLGSLVTGGTSFWFVAFKILQNLFPLLVFCVVGLHTDILQLWFPCCWKRKAGTRTIQDDNITASSNKADEITQENEGDLKHLLETGSEEKDFDDSS